MFGNRVIERQVISGTTDAPYVPGLMALRVGRLMERTVARWPVMLMCCYSMRLLVIIREEQDWRCTSVRSWSCQPSE